jgi:hypothetical protein
VTLIRAGNYVASAARATGPAEAKQEGAGPEKGRILIYVVRKSLAGGGKWPDPCG